MAVRLCDVLLMTARTERLTFARNITATNTAAFGFRRTKRLKRTNKLPEAIGVSKEELNIGSSLDSGSTTTYRSSEKRSRLLEQMKANAESNTTKRVEYGINDSNDDNVRILDLSKKQYYKVTLWRNQS
uniref:Uncharacterized protein n=1 Tax=Ascaris lumbricoides TaxID=6252 RepID=A0A0M3IQJ1_ASCLU